MRLFDPTTTSDNSINAYLLAKFSEAMYPERLDLQLRMQENHGKLPVELISTDDLKIHPKVTDTNFREAFQLRFSHFFSSEPSPQTIRFDYLQKSKLDTTGALMGRLVLGQDPECMIINTKAFVLVIFRGTDDIHNNRFAEWIGTDFNALKTQADTIFNNSRIHKGFYKSYLLIEGELKHILSQTKASNKPIWLAGHSLGGAMAVICGVSLASQGFNVCGVYSFGGPSVIGNKKFSELTDQLLKDKVQRYEYALDPVSILTAPGYKTYGKRNWIDRAGIGAYSLYMNCPERRFFLFQHKKSLIQEDRIKKELLSSRLSQLPYEFYHHNTQWIVKGLFLATPDTLKEFLPLPEDTFPFIYYAWDKAK